MSDFADFLRELAAKQLHEYYRYWEGYHPGAWIPKSLYANRCYDRYERMLAVAEFLSPTHPQD